MSARSIGQAGRSTGGLAAVGATWSLAVARACAADGPPSEKLPPLLPPHSEIPPTFWELHLWHVVAAGMVFLGLLSVLVWWWTRPRQPVITPPAIKARAALEPLAQQPETGPVLTRVSQALRGYFAAVFGLPPGELTTGEFAQAVNTSDRTEPDLATAVVRLLRACDERKFAPAPPPAPLGAVSEALQLINRAEARRVEAARAAESTGSAVPPGQPAATRPSASS